MTQTAGYELVVDHVCDISPGMRRVCFAGQAVRDYLASGPYLPNIKLYFAEQGRPLDLPASDGHRITWAGNQRSRVRTYTVRYADPEAGTMSIDFVRHGDGGLASGWAEAAVPGSTLGAFGGGGLVVGEADWVLLVGDETALPAIGAMFERFAPTQRGIALIEVADAGEQQDLAAPEGFEVHWLHRNGAAAGTTTLLSDALAALELPQEDLDEEQVRIWVSAESAVVRFARRHFKAMGFNRRHHLVIGYWHLGMSESGYATASDHDRVAGELEAVLPGQELPEDDHAHDQEHEHAH